MKHFLTLDDFTKEELLQILEIAKDIKMQTKQRIFKPFLDKKTLAMIFQKNSTRTRVSFEVGMYQLGGHALYLNSLDLQLGRGESIKDTSRVMSKMCDMILFRANKHEDIEEFAKYSDIPVINGLSDYFHPLQIMADYMTIKEHFINDNITYIGDGNNIANSWLILASKLGLTLKIATPRGYEPKEYIIKKALKNSKQSGAKLIFTNSPKEAVQNANVVITDTWFSMGDEVDKDVKKKDFKDFCVNKTLMNLANKNAIFLHCLPAYKNIEVSEEVFEEHSKEIFLESENRLHIQKGIMVWLDKERGNYEK